MKTNYAALGNASLERLRETTANARQVQLELLNALLEKNKGTVYGKKYGFEEVRSLRDYQEKVPITYYEDYDAYIREMLEGTENVLTAEPPTYYSISSGSTGGAKYLPVSEEDMNIHYKYAYGVIFGMVREHYCELPPEQIFGKILQIGEFAKTYTDSGVMNGIRSSSLYQWMDADGEFDTSDYCVPKEVLFPNTLEDLIYIKVRFALEEREISAIQGVFIHRVVGAFSYIEKYWDVLLNDMEHGTIDESIPLSGEWRAKLIHWLPPNRKRAEELRRIPREGLGNQMITKIWKNVKYILTIGGGGFPIYMEQLRKYTGDIPVHYFAYAASEGILGVSRGMNTPDQYVLLPESGIFEFAPVNDDDQRPLFMGELELGVEYALIFTNQSGLYRYEMMDVVEVVGFYGQAPIIRFCYRKNQVISIADERTNTAQFEQSMCLFSTITKMGYIGYGIQADYSVQPGRYLIYIESIEDYDLYRAEAYDSIMELCLQKSILGYAGCRKMHEILPAHVALLPHGSFARYEKHLAATGHQMGQNKPLRVLDSAEKCSFFEGELKRNIK